jgi:hypothetical protein
VEISTFSHQVSSVDIHRGSALSTAGKSAPIAHFKSTPTVLGGKYEIRDDCTVSFEPFMLEL